MKNILILTSGNISKIEAFGGFDGVTLASFNDVCYTSEGLHLKLKSGEDLRDFNIIYFRFVGKSLEVATLVSDYAKRHDIQIVDRLYTNSQLMPASLGKSIEIRKLIEAGIEIPKTVFGDFSKMNFPFVVKSTTGQRAREVWLVKDKEELIELLEKIDKKKFYFAQEFIPNAKRIRALVIGEKCVGAILRHSKWNKDDTKETLDPIPEDVSKMALDAARAVDMDICGVDILVNSKTNKKYLIEANAAPSWKLINKYCGLVVEEEIIKYLSSLV